MELFRTTTTVYRRNTGRTPLRSASLLAAEACFVSKRFPDRTSELVPFPYRQQAHSSLHTPDNTAYHSFPLCSVNTRETR